MTRRAARYPLAPNDPRHGSASGYTNHGCRCEPCKAARAAYYQETRNRAATDLVDAHPVGHHVRTLIAAGCSTPQIARAAGTSTATIDHLKHGRTKRVAATTAAAVLAVTADQAPARDRGPRPKPGTVPADQAAAHVNQLLRHGASQGRIADATGIRQRRIGHIATSDTRYITPAEETAILELTIDQCRRLRKKPLPTRDPDDHGTAVIRRSTMGNVRPEDWMRTTDLACKDHTDDWFPHPDDLQEMAAERCDGCPVLEQCREYAIEHRIEHGVWGGLTERERRVVIRQRDRATAIAAQRGAA